MVFVVFSEFRSSNRISMKIHTYTIFHTALSITTQRGLYIISTSIIFFLSSEISLNSFQECISNAFCSWYKIWRITSSALLEWEIQFPIHINIATNPLNHKRDNSTWWNRRIQCPLQVSFRLTETIIKLSTPT